MELRYAVIRGVEWHSSIMAVSALLLLINWIYEIIKLPDDLFNFHISIFSLVGWRENTSHFRL